MKKILLFVFLIAAFIAPVFAATSPSISFLSDDQYLSDIVQQGTTEISAKVEYWNASDVYTGDSGLALEPVDQAGVMNTVYNVPVMVTYGLTNNATVRFTAQYLRQTLIDKTTRPHDWESNGLGDSKIEMLYQLTDETANMPSVAINIGTDILTGRSYVKAPKAASDTSLDTGLYAPRYYLSAIFKKTIGDWNKKTMIGLVFEPTDKYSSGSWVPATELVMSVAASRAYNKRIDFGGELSAVFAGENIDDYTALPGEDLIDVQEHTPITKISFSPFITYKQSDNITYKAVLEYPLATKGTYSDANLSFYPYRGVNISLGANISL